MTGCVNFREALAVSRRQVLQAGGLAALGLTLPELLRADSRQSRIRAKSCILVYLFGGPPQIDLWDMKPDAPEEIRGEFKPAATQAPGISFCELTPQLGKVAHLVTVVRSMTHERNVHGGAVGFVLTGTRTEDPGIPGVRGPAATVADHPTLGAVINRFRPASVPVPTAITLPYSMIDGQGQAPPGQTAGILGEKYNPWFVDGDPNSANFRVEGLSLPGDLSAGRLGARQTLLQQIENQRRGIDRLGEVREMEDHYQRAFSLLTSSRTQEAFRLDREPRGLRDRYGRNSFGQSCLLARRLIEAGVRFVQVNMGSRLDAPHYGWDTHANNFKSLRKPLLPVFDAGFPTLLADLHERGLLNDTLVVCMSEFGRTPKVDKRNGGRDHWPQCYSILLAGAGIRGGAIYGQSDKIAAYPTLDPVTPEDLVATIYDALGVDPATQIHDHQKRPLALVHGQAVRGLWG